MTYNSAQVDREKEVAAVRQLEGWAAKNYDYKIRGRDNE